MVERLRTLSVEHLKVMAASRACLRILFNLLIWCQISNQRAPKGPLLSLLVEHLKVQFTYWPLKLSNQWAPPDLMVEHLKVMAASRACLRILSLWSSASGP